MPAPYAFWGHVPVYVEPLDFEFIRDFTIGSRTRPSEIAPNGTTTFYSIEILTTADYDFLPEWHDRQVREGVEEGIRRQPGGPPLVPAHGFYLVAKQYRCHSNVKEEVGVVSELCLFESWSGLSFGKQGRPAHEHVARTSDERGLESLGGSDSPFADLFGQLASHLPAVWPGWVKRRRLKRWTPVPEWLAAIKAQRR